MAKSRHRTQLTAASDRQAGPRQCIPLAGDDTTKAKRATSVRRAVCGTATNQRSTTADPRAPARASPAAVLSPSVQRVAGGDSWRQLTKLCVPQERHLFV